MKRGTRSALNVMLVVGSMLVWPAQARSATLVVEITTDLQAAMTAYPNDLLPVTILMAEQVDVLRPRGVELCAGLPSRVVSHLGGQARARGVRNRTPLLGIVRARRVPQLHSPRQHRTDLADAARCPALIRRRSGRLRPRPRPAASR